MGVERAKPSRAGARLFAGYAFASLVPVVVLGVVLVRTEQRSSLARGLAQGGAQAAVIAQMAIAPTLDGRDLGAGLTDSERDRLHHATDLSIYSGSLTAIRLRSFAGDVVFADDGGSADPLPRTDPAFLTAAGGHTAVAVVPALSGAAGRVIRVLLPVVPNSTGQAVGVLELYLPYSPIEAAGRAEAHQTYLRLAQGLGLLYLVLALISWSTTRRLRVYAARQAYHARHDALTGLPNRSWYREQAQTALAAATRGQPGAIVLIDLDRFKEVNDTLGHHAGDELLECVAQRLRASLRTDDRVARLGGDEFGLILPGISNPQTALDLLARVQQELGADVEIAGRTLSIEASFGVVMYPEHGTDLSLLMRHADAAMYQGKRGIERIVVWRPGTADAPTRWHEIQSELQRALEQDELVLYYQPKLNLESGQVHGMEALLRWNHPERGLLLPSEFIAAAEASTLIEPLTRWVLHRALADQRAWKARGACWAVAVNVSVRNLESAGFAEYVLRQVRDAGAQPSELTLELTETAFAADNARAVAAIATLDRAGVAVSLDDFGTGATGLLQLRNLAVREMKIDRAFVTDLARNSHDRDLVRALVDLGHRLGCRVVAEGVEEQHCADWLQSVGCDDAQGFLYQRPALWQSMLAHFGPSVPAERVAAAAPGSAPVADHAASEASRA